MRLGPLVDDAVPGGERRVLLEKPIHVGRRRRRVICRRVERGHAVPDVLPVGPRDGRRRREHRGQHALQLAAREPEPPRDLVEKTHDLPRDLRSGEGQPRAEKRVPKRLLPLVPGVEHLVHDDAPLRVLLGPGLPEQEFPRDVVNVVDRAKDVVPGGVREIALRSPE